MELAGAGPEGVGRQVNFFAGCSCVCRRCGALLCDTSDKFESGRGWAAFDDSEAEAAPARPDPSSPDGRTEIVCANCLRRPGHVFEGGGHTWRNLRRCVNSVSISFVGGATAGDDGLKAGRAEIERLKKGRDDDE